METVEFRLRVPLQPLLDPTARLAILDEGTLTEMPFDISEGLLQRPDMAYLFVFRVMLGDTGIFMSEDWVVRIVGNRILDCVYALCALISLIIDLFDTSVSVDLITLRNRNASPLHRFVVRKSRLAKVRGWLWWILGILIASVVSGVLGAWIGIKVFGG